jgi:HD-like signal output (HDOD) protein
MLIFTCECGQRMKVSPKLLGKTSKCVRCGIELCITEESTRPFPEEAPSEAAPPKKQTGPVDVSACGPIGRILMEHGLVTDEQVQEALTRQKESGGRVLENLIALEHLDKSTLHDFLSRQSGVAAMDIKNYNIPSELADLVPRDFAQERLVVPIDKLGRLLTVGMAIPLDVSTIADLEERTGLKVKPMLCKWDDVLSTIDRYYPSDGSQKRPVFELPSSKPKKARPTPTAEEIAGRLAELDSLPVLPETVLRIREAVDGENCTIRDLLGIVEEAPAVAAKLLSTANSILYGMPGQVDGLALAATLLGVDGVCDTVVTSEIEGASHDLHQFDLATFGADALFCATVAAAIAEACDQELATAAHAAGLLHAIGRLALAETFPEHYAEIPEGLSKVELLKEEERVMGMPSPEAGYALAQAWALPESIGQAIRGHRAPVDAGGEALVAVVRLAAAMADAHAAGNGAETGSFPQDALKALSLDEAEAARIFKEAGAHLA